MVSCMKTLFSACSSTLLNSWSKLKNSRIIFLFQTPFIGLGIFLKKEFLLGRDCSLLNRAHTKVYSVNFL